MKESRVSNVKKNIFFGNLSNIVLSILNFVLRTIFIYILGPKYLGISGILTNILGILSFTELGIGGALNFALYKPIAENDKEKIKSILSLYKKAYQLIALLITIFGILLIPYLKYFVNTDIPMADINIYFVIFLFNTVSSYFVSYKTSYVSAIQKNYIVNNIDTAGKIVCSILQIISIVVTSNYLVFLIVQSFVNILQKIIMVNYLNFKYPILKEKNIQPLDAQTKNKIWKNVKALMVHRIGEVSVHSTDNIIISTFVSTTTVGLVSNYLVLNNMVAMFTNTLFSSFTASFGDLLVDKNKAKQKEIFELYDFMGFWVYGFVFIAFVTLAQPFVTLWIGKEMLVDNLTVFLFFLSIYLAGQSLTTYTFKVAAGKFDEDKWVALVQAIVNLTVSIIAVQMIGLPGVYVGTIAQRLIVNVVRPIIVYNKILGESTKRYFIRFIIRLIVIFSISIFLNLISVNILYIITWETFFYMCLITAIIPNLIIALLYWKTGNIQAMVKKII